MKSDRELLGDELSDGIHEVGQYLLGGRLDPLMAHRLRAGYKLLLEARSKLAAAARAEFVKTDALAKAE